MNKQHYTEEMGTTPFYCENCGEMGWETRFWLEGDEWTNIHPSIEYLCADCFEKESK